MSIAKVKEAAAATKDDYIAIPAAVLADALKEDGDAGELAAIVNKAVERNPGAVVQVHRDKHIGKILGVPKLAVKS